MDETLSPLQDTVIHKKQDAISLHMLIRDNDTSAIASYCKNLKTDDIQIIESFDKEGNTPLICAINQKNEEITELLLTFGANPNQPNEKGDTPLIATVKANVPSMTLRLIEEGAHINQTNSDQESPLKIATKLDHKECVNALIEHGASFTKNNASPTKHSINPTQTYLDSISSFIRAHATKENSAKIIKSIFENSIRATETYLNRSFDNKALSDNLEKLRGYISDSFPNLESEKFVLNISRKIIVNIHSQIKILLIQDNDTHSINLMSKAENSSEEQIAKLKYLDTKINSHEENNAQTKNKINQDNSSSTISSQIHSKDCDFMTDKILCRTARHDVVLTITASIKPHYLRTNTQIEKIIHLSKDLLNEEELSRVSEILKSCSNEEELSSEGIKSIEQILRHGKAEKIHILHFSNHTHVDNDIYSEAIETGATIHCLQYPSIAEETNDFVLTGIANLNKLLDDGIHPDKIFLQGRKDQEEIINITLEQFTKRGVRLTKIMLDQNKDCKSDHRIFSPHFPIAISEGCNKSIFDNINKIHNKTKISFTKNQLINLFIASQQEFLRSSGKHRNPTLPNERVENIIGLTDGDDQSEFHVE